MVSEKHFFSQGFQHQPVYHIHYIFLGVFFPKQSYVWGKCIPQQVLAEGNSIISNRWKTWDRERSIFYENPEHFSYKSLHMHCIVIAKINQYFLFLFQLWTVRQPNPRRQKKDTNHSLKETHRNTVLFDVKPFSNLKSLAARPNWAFDEWNLTTTALTTKLIENPNKATLSNSKDENPYSFKLQT